MSTALVSEVRRAVFIFEKCLADGLHPPPYVVILNITLSLFLTFPFQAEIISFQHSAAPRAIMSTGNRQIWKGKLCHVSTSASSLNVILLLTLVNGIRLVHSLSMSKKAVMIVSCRHLHSSDGIFCNGLP